MEMNIVIRALLAVAELIQSVINRQPAPPKDM